MNLKKASGLIIKILLLLIGFGDFFGLLPDSLDLIDKLLTSFILLYFWFKLRPAGFLFGIKSRKLDVLVLASYYIFILNTFLQFVRGVDDQLMNSLTVGVNMFSFYGGTILLLVTAVVVTFYLNLGEKSVLHSIVSLFNNKENFWSCLKKKRQYPVMKFLMSVVVLYSIAIYFFGLINQWFVVSLDKSLLILAILFAVKDLEKSKVEAFHTVGEFDDIVLKSVTKLFTSPKTVAFGFGLLLLMHYLSDIGTFFVSYLTHFIGLDASYYALGEAAHLSLYSHFLAEPAGGFFAGWTYVLSGLGALFILIVPLVTCFFLVFGLDFKKLVERRFYTFVLILMFISMAIYKLAPWVAMYSIENVQHGIIGVDFVTHTISSQAMFSFGTLFAISLVLLIIGFFSINKKAGKYLTVIIFGSSLFYLGKYCWNYFISAFDYYNALIGHFISQSNYYFSVNFGILGFMDFVFYIVGFIGFAYYAFRYIISQIMKDLITDNAIWVWTILLMLVPMLVLYPLGSVSTMENFLQVLYGSSAVMIVLFLFSLALFKELRGREHRDDFILGVTISILAYQIFLLISVFMEMRLGWEDGLLSFLQPLVILLVALIALWSFKMKFAGYLRPYKMLSAILLGVPFGLLFYLVNEPALQSGELLSGGLFGSLLLAVVVFSFLVALSEELLFRGLVFKLAERAFNFKPALIIQAFVFALMHLVNIIGVYAYYSVVDVPLKFLAGSPLMLLLFYFLFLFVYSLFLGYLSDERKGGNIIYAIVNHFVVNLVLLGVVIYII